MPGHLVPAVNCWATIILSLRDERQRRDPSPRKPGFDLTHTPAVAQHSGRGGLLLGLAERRQQVGVRLEQLAVLRALDRIGEGLDGLAARLGGLFGLTLGGLGLGEGVEDQAATGRAQPRELLLADQPGIGIGMPHGVALILRAIQAPDGCVERLLDGLVHLGGLGRHAGGLDRLGQAVAALQTHGPLELDLAHEHVGAPQAVLAGGLRAVILPPLLEAFVPLVGGGVGDAQFVGGVGGLLLGGLQRRGVRLGHVPAQVVGLRQARRGRGQFRVQFGVGLGQLLGALLGGGLGLFQGLLLAGLLLLQAGSHGLHLLASRLEQLQGLLLARQPAVQRRQAHLRLPAGIDGLGQVVAAVGVELGPGQGAFLQGLGGGLGGADLRGQVAVRLLVGVEGLDARHVVAGLLQLGELLLQLLELLVGLVELLLRPGDDLLLFGDRLARWRRSARRSPARTWRPGPTDLPWPAGRSSGRAAAAPGVWSAGGAVSPAAGGAGGGPAQERTDLREQPAGSRRTFGSGRRGRRGCLVRWCYRGRGRCLDGCLHRIAGAVTLGFGAARAVGAGGENAASRDSRPFTCAAASVYQRKSSVSRAPDPVRLGLVVGCQVRQQNRLLVLQAAPAPSWPGSGPRRGSHPAKRPRCSSATR